MERQRLRYHPYELLEGMDCFTFFGVNGRHRWFRKTSTSGVFSIPDIDVRLFRCARTLEDAVEVRCLDQRLLQAGCVGAVATERNSHCVSQGVFDQAWFFCRRMFRRAVSMRLGVDSHSPASHLIRRESNAEFVYYVSGGYVVSEILGHRSLTDGIGIDVWFAPQQPDARNLFVVCGRGCYPVNVFVSPEPMDYFETDEMAICQCAIKCCYKLSHGKQGKRSIEYQLIMTPACVLAWMSMRCVVLENGPCRLANSLTRLSRVEKYAKRGLVNDSSLWVLRESRGSSDSVLFFASGVQPRPYDGSSRAFWFIQVVDGDLLDVTFYVPGPGALSKIDRLRVSRASCKEAEMIDATFASDPVIVESCPESVSKLELLCGKSWPVLKPHWVTNIFLNRMKTMVAIPGVGYVWSSSLLPRFLAESLELDESSFVRRLRREVLLFEWDSKWPAVETFVIECTRPARPMQCLKNWAFRSAVIDTAAENRSALLLHLDLGNASEMSLWRVCGHSTVATCKYCTAPFQQLRCRLV